MSGSRAGVGVVQGGCVILGAVLISEGIVVHDIEGVVGTIGVGSMGEKHCGSQMVGPMVSVGQGGCWRMVLQEEFR